MKTQLYQTPEKGKGGPINESQTTLNEAKMAIDERRVEFTIFLIETPHRSYLYVKLEMLYAEHFYVLSPLLNVIERSDKEGH
jgi:hypothetical protein